MSKKGKTISQRQLRVGEMIKQALGMIFLRDEAKLPNLQTKEITVTEVRMSQDLKTAKAFVLPLGGKNAQEAIEKLKELNNQYSLMKDDGYDLIYYDCDTWLGKDAMNTELFSVRTSACSDKLLNILSFQEYDKATDVVHEKTYLNLFDNKKKFNYGSVNKTMGYFRFDDEKDTNELKDIDLINTVIMTNVMFYLFTLKNNVLNKCTIDNEFYDSLDVTDSILIMHNQTENNINVNYLFYDENFVEINFVKNVIGNGTFNYYNVSFFLLSSSLLLCCPVVYGIK